MSKWYGFPVSGFVMIEVEDDQDSSAALKVAKHYIDPNVKFGPAGLIKPSKVEELKLTALDVTSLEDNA